MKRQRIKRLIFFVTNRCNCRCAHCFYWQNLNQKGEMSFQEIERIIDGFGYLKSLLLSGGEPFLREDLSDICDCFIERCKIKRLQIPTNGTLEEPIIEFVKKFSLICKLSLNISIDGLKETHDGIRGKACFDKAMGTLHALREFENPNFSVRVMMTVSNKNIKEIYDFSKTISEYGFDFSLTPVRGIPKDQGVEPPSSSEWVDLINRIRPFYKLHGKGWLMNFFHGINVNRKTKMYRNALNDIRDYICEAGTKVGVLEYDGNVRLCELTPVIGNVKNYGYDFYKVWTSKAADNMRNQIEDCVCTHTCFIKSKKRIGDVWC